MRDEDQLGTGIVISALLGVLIGFGAFFGPAVWSLLVGIASVIHWVFTNFFLLMFFLVGIPVAIYVVALGTKFVGGKLRNWHETKANEKLERRRLEIERQIGEGAWKEIASPLSQRCLVCHGMAEPVRTLTLIYRCTQCGQHVAGPSFEHTVRRWQDSISEVASAALENGNADQCVHCNYPLGPSWHSGHNWCPECGMPAPDWQWKFLTWSTVFED